MGSIQVEGERRVRALREPTREKMLSFLPITDAGQVILPGCWVMRETTSADGARREAKVECVASVCRAGYYVSDHAGLLGVDTAILVDYEYDNLRISLFCDYVNTVFKECGK